MEVREFRRTKQKLSRLGFIAAEAGESFDRIN
jgi:hypothetical protein